MNEEGGKKLEKEEKSKNRVSKKIFLNIKTMNR